MPVFKCFFRILYKNKSSFILYFSIFMAMMFVFSMLQSENNISEFSTSKVNAGVVDYDHSESSEALVKYMEQESNVVPAKTEKTELMDQLFYRDLEYVLYIPSGFEQFLKEGKTPELENVKVPNSYTGMFMDMKINNFINILSCYLENGMNVKDAVSQTVQSLEQETDVILQNGNGLSSKPKYYAFYTYYAYIIMAISILGMGVILSQLNKKEIEYRMKVSSLSQTAYQKQLFLASIIYSLGIWALTNMSGIIVYHKEINFFDYLPYLLLNSGIITIVSVSFSFVIGFLVKSGPAINGAANTVSLSCAFLGGIFVPQEMMNEGVLKVAQFVPSYWYVDNINIMMKSSLSSAEFRKEYWLGTLIMTAFALAGFGIAMIAKKVKEKG